MPRFKFEQPIQQLEARKGGYFYLENDANRVDQFEEKRATRLKCIIDEKVALSCGLNHLGDGNFYIIIAKRYVQKLKKELGDKVTFEIFEDPNPLGVEMPEALEVLLEQDPDAKEAFEKLTDGKKRSLIFAIKRVKDIDKQIGRIIDFLGKNK